jgi:heme oxygenase
VVAFEPKISPLPQAVIRERMTNLRGRTASVHARLEEQVESSGWLRSIAGYRDLLTRLYGFYAPLEPLLFQTARHLELTLDLESRRKTPHLEHDLHMLGMSHAEIRALPQTCIRPVHLSDASLFGYLYVMEGATLGGQVITRRLRQQFGETAQTPVAFFSSYGAEVGRRWLNFCSLLASVLEHPESERLVVASAIEAFERFSQWLEKGDAPIP